MSLEITATGIGPQKWKNSTLNNIRLTQNIIKSSDKSNYLGRVIDPLPNLRDVVAELSNREAIRYCRDVRVVVIRLREHFLATNDEIKSLVKSKESAEKQLEHIRKDMHLNKESRRIRSARPHREHDQDGADDLLNAETLHLQNLKAELEQVLCQIRSQLQSLDHSRKSLASVINERSRVLDLLNVSVGSARFSETARGTGDRNGMFTDRPKTAQSDPLSAFTPACEAAIKESEVERNRSRMLRNEACEKIDKVQKLQNMAHKSVNNGLTRKVAETLTLHQQLNLASADNRAAVNRAQRWFNITDKTRAYNLGPVSSADLFTRETVSRPVMKTYQRHPGTQVPEAQIMIKGCVDLQESLAATGRNIELLKLGNIKLQQDITDKRRAYYIDTAALRKRRQFADHKDPIGY